LEVIPQVFPPLKWVPEKNLAAAVNLLAAAVNLVVELAAVCLTRNLVVVVAKTAPRTI
jgi:hypothetical protein